MSVFPPQAHFHLMAKPSSFHCNIQCEYCFYLEKSEQFGQHAPFMSKDTLKHYVKNYIHLTLVMWSNLLGKVENPLF